MAYDFMSGEYHNINANAPPFGNRSLITDPPGRFDDPYSGRRMARSVGTCLGNERRRDEQPEG